MTKKKRGFLRAVALCLLVCVCVSVTACNTQPGEETQPDAQTKATHTITLKSQSGQPLTGVGVTVYTDETQSELVWFAKSDEEGKITFTDLTSDSYIAVLSNLPTGFQAEAYYPMTGTDTEIVLSAVLEQVEDLTTVTYKLGDVMNDFTVTDAEGKSYTLSELLREKNAVVLNFWYLECNPCKMEFPYLQAAYEVYGDTVEVLAMNPVNTDGEAVAAFREENGYTFPMMVVDAGWSEAMALTAYPTTVVIDRYGTITMIHTGTLDEEGVWESIFDFFGSEDYVQQIIEDVEDLPEAETEQEVGTAENPIEMGAMSSFTLTVPANGQVHLTIYRVTNYYLQIRSPYATITYNGKTYTPSNGAVGVSLVAEDTMSAVKLVVGNTSGQEQTFSVTMSSPQGSYGNPYSLELGEFEVTVPAGNNQGIYYTYTAQEDGVLTVKCLSVTSGVAYDLVLYNLSTYAYRNLMSDPQKGEDGYYYVSVNVKAGNKIQFIAGSLPDDSGSYPRADFKLLATMGEAVADEKEEEEKLTYSVTITDENRNPVAGVQVYLNVKGETVNISTNANGVAHTKLAAGTYSATIKVPGGFEARTTGFQLSEAIPNIAVKLDTIVVEMAVYTVTVVNYNGEPVPGALVSIGDTFGYTDDNGVATFTLVKDTYTAAVSADGYVDNSASFFGGATEMTVMLEEGEPEVENGVVYSVTVTDYFGNPMSGVTVSFLKNGTAAAIKTTDAAGMVSRTLEAGEYTVALAFSSGSYHYTTAVLTEQAPGATVVVVEKPSGDYVSSYVGELYAVSAGATYAELQSGVVNYFLFTPTQAGYYSFTTADPSDTISYWGGNLSYIADMTGSVEFANNTFMLNIKQEAVDNGLCYVIGISGSGGCTLVIRRLGDPQTDIYDLPWSTEWMEGVELPASRIKVTESGTLTYMNVSQTYALVLGSDGYYHVGSAEGPVLYLQLDSSAPYISFADLLANGGMKVYFFDEEGNFLKKEEYTDYMNACVTYMDTAYGVYPVTETLAYILQTYGEYVGWFDSTNDSYIFGTVTADPNSAWLFACCYFS